MPDPAEVDGLMLLLKHLDDLGEALDTSHEWVFHGFAKVRGEIQKRGWIEVLIAQEDHLVVEQGLSDFSDQSRVFWQKG